MHLHVSPEVQSLADSFIANSKRNVQLASSLRPDVHHRCASGTLPLVSPMSIRPSDFPVRQNKHRDPHYRIPRLRNLVRFPPSGGHVLFFLRSVSRKKVPKIPVPIYPWPFNPRKSTKYIHYSLPSDQFIHPKCGDSLLKML